MTKYKNIPGPWDREPDYESGTTKVGLPYYMCRNNSHAWCGYVGHTKSGYVLSGKYHEFGICHLSDVIDVHGGITWNNDHKPQYTADGLYWYGFDCDHCGDMTPDYTDSPVFSDYVYRDIDYVRNECERLAQQIADAKTVSGCVIKEHIKALLK